MNALSAQSTLPKKYFAPATFITLEPLPVANRLSAHPLPYHDHVHVTAIGRPVDVSHSPASISSGEEGAVHRCSKLNLNPAQ